MLDQEPHSSVDTYLKQQSRRFSFLVDPESYLLAASVASGVFAVPFLILNLIAIQCLLENCPGLHNGSNTAMGWILFEGITLSFVLISWGTGSAYWRARQQKGQ
jgi:hypothetical protein